MENPSLRRRCCSRASRTSTSACSIRPTTSPRCSSSGKNTLGFMLGGGWHGSPLTWSGNRFFAGPELLRAQLDITFEDGHHETIGTDDTWQTAAAPVLSSEIYGGEAYDARAEIPGWNEAGFAAHGMASCCNRQLFPMM